MSGISSTLATLACLTMSLSLPRSWSWNPWPGISVGQLRKSLCLSGCLMGKIPRICSRRSLRRMLRSINFCFLAHLGHKNWSFGIFLLVYILICNGLWFLFLGFGYSLLPMGFGSSLLPKRLVLLFRWIYLITHRISSSFLPIRMDLLLCMWDLVLLLCL